MPKTFDDYQYHDLNLSQKIGSRILKELKMSLAQVRSKEMNR